MLLQALLESCLKYTRHEYILFSTNNSNRFVWAFGYLNTNTHTCYLNLDKNFAWDFILSANGCTFGVEQIFTAGKKFNFEFQNVYSCFYRSIEFPFNTKHTFTPLRQMIRVQIYVSWIVRIYACFFVLFLCFLFFFLFFSVSAGKRQ